MDAFEDLVARLLRREGFWTRQNYKVDITKAEKVKIGLPSMPRPDVDIVAYQAVENTVVWVECKSYLDSYGVQMSAFDGSNPKLAKRFRMFTDPKSRQVVTAALLRQLIDENLARPKPKIEYWLVAGNIRRGSQAALAAHFEASGWRLRDREWVTSALRRVADDGYEDDVVTMAAKLLRP